MLRRDKYRFCLQWGSDTEEKVEAGSLLDRLGNRKSDIVVAAIAEYIQHHPEIVAADPKIEITYRPKDNGAQMEEMVRQAAKAAVEELLAGKTLVQTEETPTQGAPSKQDLQDMVAGLQMFDM